MWQILNSIAVFFFYKKLHAKLTKAKYVRVDSKYKLHFNQCSDSNNRNEFTFFVFKHTARQKHDTQNKTKKSKYIVSISMPFKTGDITQENHGDTGMFLDGYLATKLSGLTFT